MYQKTVARLFIICLLTSPILATAQLVEKVSFGNNPATDYYLATSPASGNVKGVLVLFCSVRPPESMLPETRMNTVAAAGDILTIYASLGRTILADSGTLARMNAILQHIVTKYTVDTSTFVLGGFDMAGSIALRYTELAVEHPEQCVIRPKAVFGVSSFVDLTGLYHYCERQIKKNYFPPAVGDAKQVMGLLTGSLGSPTERPDGYQHLSPFNRVDETAGNEQFLRSVAVRLYYDIDIAWQLNSRRNSLYDTNIPDGSELISRLLLTGNTHAEFVPAKQPGMRTNGTRQPNSLSIVDEIEFVQWIKKTLHIFDPTNLGAFSPTYKFAVPEGWNLERSPLPPSFAPAFGLKGFEEIRFPPGWPVASSDQYWSVAYLFWLNGGQTVDAPTLEQNLTIYFDGLIKTGGGGAPHQLPSQPVPTRIKLQKTKPEPGDGETFAGTIDMLDYMAGKPITLHVLVHLNTCGDPRHVPLFIEASPKSFDQPIWNDLKSMKNHFSCAP
jgi:hypothetical protein